ncbi:MAG: long-chain fatty acid--CoA ligase [candidate division KSB1 bacterium]|nr:long-chain fatty acid--CoA ligase [candidate division KSB1 bacterium]
MESKTKQPSAFVRGRSERSSVAYGPAGAVPPFDFEHLLPLPEILRRSARLYPDKPAIHVRQKENVIRISYRELDHLVDALAAGLIRWGVRTDDRIAFLSENRPEWIAVYFGAQRAGAISVPLDPQLGASDLRHLLIQSESRLIFTSSRFLDLVSEAAQGVSTLEGIVLFDPNGGEPNALRFQDLVDRGRYANLPFPTRELDDLAAIIFTSGTTGLAKGVMLTHRNLSSDCAACLELFPVTEQDVFYALLPLHHTFPAMASMIVPIAVGASITIGSSLKSKDILDDISRTGVTIFAGVPLLFEKMIEGILKEVQKKPLFTRAMFKTILGISRLSFKALRVRAGSVLFKSLRQKAGLQSLRLIVSGGAPISPEVIEMYNYLGFQFVQGYGLTETSPVLSMTPPDKLKARSVGPPVRGVEVRIVNPDEDGVGEIVVRGPMVMKGYYKNPVETAKVLKNGWFYTGDLGWIDEDGFIYIAGRAKNVIVTKGGKNVYPEELEEKLLKSPYIQEVLVVGRQNERGDEYIHAIVYPNLEAMDQLAKERNQQSLTEEEIEEVIRQEIRTITREWPAYKAIQSFELIQEEFPKTSTRKIKRYLFQHRIIGVGAKR